MAVLRAEIQRETKRLSTPNLWAKNIPPPTVTIQTGHWAWTGKTKNEKQEMRNKKPDTRSGVVNDKNMSVYYQNKTGRASTP